MTIANSGWIEAICGPMFSGKTEELIRRLRRAQIARRRVQVFKPALDSRYSESELVTHGNVRMAATPVDSASDILMNVDGNSEVVGIDESHFFGAALVEVADELADRGKQVIVAGLDTDFLGRPFPPMPELLAIAESVAKTLAVCMQCGAPAKHTQRLLSSRELIVVGAAEAYEARCRRCFMAVAPSRDTLDSLSNAR